MGEAKKELTPITIEEIKNNPNLDISNRKRGYANYGLSDEEVETMILEQIKSEYNSWLKKRTNKNKRTDDLLEKILNGHSLSKIEAFEMTCDDPRELEEYYRTETIRSYITKNRGINKKDFDALCDDLGLDELTKNKIERAYKTNGFIREDTPVKKIK